MPRLKGLVDRFGGGPVRMVVYGHRSAARAVAAGFETECKRRRHGGGEEGGVGVGVGVESSNACICECRRNLISYLIYLTIKLQYLNRRLLPPILLAWRPAIQVSFPLSHS